MGWRPSHENAIRLGAMAVSFDTCVRPCGGVEVRSIGDGAVVLDLSTGNCFELNRVGFEIWELLANGATPKSIWERLKDRYDTAQELLAKDVLRLLDSLIQQSRSNR